MTASIAAREMTSTDSATFLRRVLYADAATCLATGALLTLGAAPLSGLLGLPAALLAAAGASLFPSAALMLWVATRARIPALGAWIVILGNAAWVLGSAWLALALSMTTLGYAFVIAQAVVVALLAELEYVGLKKMR